MIKTLSFAGQQVPIPGFGAMGLNSSMGSDLDLKQSEPVLLKAIELGCTFWDTAVSRVFTLRRLGWVLISFLHKIAYKNGENEKLLGDFIKKHNVRDKLFGEEIDFYLPLQWVIGLCYIRMQWPPSVDLRSSGLNEK